MWEPCNGRRSFWRAAIFSEFALSFGEAIVNFPVSFQALPCESAHPEAPFGEIEFSDECSLS